MALLRAAGRGTAKAKQDSAGRRDGIAGRCCDVLGYGSALQRSAVELRRRAKEKHREGRIATALRCFASCRLAEARQSRGTAAPSGARHSLGKSKHGAATQWQSLALRRFGIAQRGDAWAMPRRTMQRQSSAMRGLGSGTARQSDASARSGDWRTPRNLIWRHLHVHCRST